MPYSSKADVEFYGQFTIGGFGVSGYDYTNSIMKAIDAADRKIDEYLQVPEQFFSPGGIEITREYHDGTEVNYIGGVTKFFNWFYGGTSHLKFNYHPVLSVTKLEEETSAAVWTTRTEGSGSDYIVTEDGVRYVNNTPSWKWKNVRATYKAGYATTPSIISEVSGKLAAAILKNILDTNRKPATSIQGLATGEVAEASLSREEFTDEMKRQLERYKQVVYAFS